MFVALCSFCIRIQRLQGPVRLDVTTSLLFAVFHRRTALIGQRFKSKWQKNGFRLFQVRWPPSAQCQIRHMPFGDQSAISAHYDAAHAQSRTIEAPPRAEHSDSRHKCVVCGRKFATKGNLSRHLETVHNPDGPRYECKVCGKKFTQKGHLSQHRTNIHGFGDVKIFQCDFCPKVCKAKHNLKTHMTLVHGVGDVKSFQCNVCSKAFKFRSHLKRHLADVHKQ